MTDEAVEQAPEAVASRQTRVARVLDGYRLVLNVGRVDGVRTHHNFLVFGIGPDIIDPETGENLGALEVVRGRGKVEHLQERFCTVRSVEVRRVPGLKKTIRREGGNSIRTGLLRGFGSEPVEEVEEGMQVISQPFDNAEVGDFARKI
jgi:hypothetical protein